MRKPSDPLPSMPQLLARAHQEMLAAQRQSDMVQGNLLAASPAMPARMRRPVWSVSDYRLLRHLHAGYCSQVYHVSLHALGRERDEGASVDCWPQLLVLHGCVPAFSCLTTSQSCSLQRPCLPCAGMLQGVGRAGGDQGVRPRQDGRPAARAGEGSVSPPGPLLSQAAPCAPSLCPVPSPLSATLQLYREIKLHSRLQHDNVVMCRAAFLVGAPAAPGAALALSCSAADGLQACPPFCSSHPALPPTHALQEDKCAVIVQEFCAGGDFLRVMHKCVADWAGTTGNKPAKHAGTASATQGLTHCSHGVHPAQHAQGWRPPGGAPGCEPGVAPAAAGA